MAGKSRSGLLERLRAIFIEAQYEADDPRSAPHLVHVLLTTRFSRKLATAGVRTHLIATGLDHEVRKFLKLGSGEDGVFGMDRRQLMLWPPDHQTILKQLDRAAVLVPSRQSFVPLTPDQISPEETAEAGNYLISKGQECIRAGNHLIRLSELGW